MNLLRRTGPPAPPAGATFRPRRPPVEGPLPEWLAYRGLQDLHGILMRTIEELDNGYCCALCFSEHLLERQTWILEAMYRQGARWVVPAAAEKLAC